MMLLLTALLLHPAFAAPGDEIIAPPAPQDDAVEPAPPLEPEALPAPIAPPAELPVAPRFSEAEQQGLSELAARLRWGDTEGAVTLGRELGASLPPHGAATAWFVIATIERERGDMVAASAALNEVNQLGGPLRALALWWLADARLEAGDMIGAAQAAQALKTDFPRDPHVTDILGVLAMAHARLGDEASARAAAAEFKARVRREGLDEAVEVELAAFEAEPRQPPEVQARAIARLREVTIHFTSPSWSEVAERLLEDLHRRGLDGATLPDDNVSLMARAASLKNSGRLDEAWALFRRLQARAEAVATVEDLGTGVGDPTLLSWVDRNYADFAWKTRQWDQLEGWYRDRYAKAPSASVAWDAYKAAGRGGRWLAARDWVQIVQERSPGTLYANLETVGRTLLCSGHPDEAAPWFDQLARQGGNLGRKGQFLSGFARHLAGEDALAVERFSRLISGNAAYAVEARYWRSRALASLDPVTAQADRDALLARDPDGWYALLVRRDLPKPASIRDGGWPAAGLPIHPLAWPGPWDAAFTPAIPWASPSLERLLGAVPQPLLQEEHRPPAGYPAGPFFRPDRAQDDLARLANAHGDTFPTLHAIADLAAAGVDSVTGPVFAALHEQLRTSAWRGDRAASNVLRALPADRWRDVFALVRDHHHTARYAWGLANQVVDPEAHLATEQLAWPVAHGSQVWSASAGAGLDPFLPLSIMRAESTYNANAVSRVGARGPMQIMPRTGHLLASRLGIKGFTPRQLHDPEVAVDFGVRYLGLLNDRFGGVWPLAVAAYNAGPHNVSAWRDGLGEGASVDAFVEIIPYVETRDYVRKVASYYSSYTRLYSEGDAVSVPWAIGIDHPHIVDF